MFSHIQPETAVSSANGVDVRLGAQHRIHRVSSWIPAGMESHALVSDGARRWPEKVGAITSISTSRRVLCIGPSEWLAIDCESGFSPLDKAPFVAVELTEGLTHIELSGEAVEELLTSVCGLDVHVTAFAVDTCARTRLAGVAVVIDRHGLAEFACYVPRSCLSYVLAALRESACGLMNIPVR